MKAFLLAAGHGTRLRPLTDQMPKCLVPIRGTPILAIWFELCRRHGIDEVLINLHSQSQKVRDFVATTDWDVQVRFSEEPTLLGSAGTLAANQAWVESESSFWVFYADILTSANLTGMASFHGRHQGLATLAACRVPDPTRSGIIVADEDGLVQEFIEKPQDPPGNLAFGGILLARPEFLLGIPRRVPADIGRDVLPSMVDRMFVHEIGEFHLDIGTSASYLSAQTAWPGLPATVATRFER